MKHSSMGPVIDNAGWGAGPSKILGCERGAIKILSLKTGAMKTTKLI